MGSRVMHAILAHELTKRIKIKDIDSFLLGAIAPDATNDKELTHFFTGDALQFSRRVDYSGFMEAFDDTVSDYHRGYYCHLIADEMWLQGFYSPWLKKLIEMKPESQGAYFKDFQILNALLQSEYTDVKAAYQSIETEFEVPVICGISNDALAMLLSALNDDFNTRSQEALQVFRYDQISAYLKRAVDHCVYRLESLSK